MGIEEIKSVIKDQTIFLRSAGINKFPGKFIYLDEEQITINGKERTVILYGWVDSKKADKMHCYVIKMSGVEFIFLDWFFMASAVWGYLIKTYTED